MGNHHIIEWVLGIMLSIPLFIIFVAATGNSRLRGYDKAALERLLKKRK